ncbi:hypothetical protein J416_03211 [Gracilibacillus halophilus YIM-C55.5]|uniref:DUF624 domain-containing protein n=1 Tax=Gracilibacillus halophilus YIM-C55.5 TaxID=1308866 RepID=N4WU02_9BACI|nr:DUF624 domain-containing protein [Gracilibacillus halophilus]ENH97840.1 hypothetical protein J416_03211 [Gracilibacillus halophilus YIM-C55.5]
MEQLVTERPLYRLIQYVYYFFLTNIYFLLANVLYLFVFSLFELRLENILVFYVGALPAGPAIAAMYASMGKLVRHQSIQPTKDFWHYYRLNFAIATKFWLLFSTMIAIMLVDIYYVNTRIPWLTPVFIAIIVCGCLLMMYGFPILSRFEVKVKNLLIVSIYATFKYVKTTILNVTTVIALAVIYVFAPGITMWFFMSVGVFFMMFNMQMPLHHLQETVSSEKTQTRADEE